jgi:hypothetical protein
MNKGVVIVAVLVVVVLGYFFLFDTGEGEEVVEQIVEEEAEVFFVPEDVSAAKARQIVTLYERVEIDNLQGLKSEELCEINFNDDEIKSNEVARADITFGESLIGERIKLSCDQFERFGINGDELMWARVISTSSFSGSFSCDYGRVTAPTVYFWFISSDDLESDYCVAPLTVLPQEKDEGECFSDEEIQEMKDACEVKDVSYHSIPDANGCETIYCGWEESQGLCTPEELLDEAWVECEAEGNTAVRYSEEVSGQDFPCAQIRCSTCPSDGDLSSEAADCSERGGEVETRMDHDTGCEFVYCGPSGDSEAEEEVEGPPLIE